MVKVLDFETDKRDDIFQIRIPPAIKSNLEKLSKQQKAELNDEILIVMSKAIHMAHFDPKVYLVTE